MMYRLLPGALVVVAVCVLGCSNGEFAPEPQPEMPQEQEEGTNQPEFGSPPERDFGSPPEEPGNDDTGMGGRRFPAQPPRGEQSESPADPTPSPGGQPPSIADPPAGGGWDEQ